MLRTLVSSSGLRLSFRACSTRTYSTTMLRREILSAPYFRVQRRGFADEKNDDHEDPISDIAPITEEEAIHEIDVTKETKSPFILGPRQEYNGTKGRNTTLLQPSHFPSSVPIMPVSGVFLPGTVMGVKSAKENTKYLSNLQRIGKGSFLGTFFVKDGRDGSKTATTGTIHRIGTLSRVLKIVDYHDMDESREIILSAVGRIVLSPSEANDFSYESISMKDAEILPLLDEEYDAQAAESKYLKEQLLHHISQAVKLSPGHRSQLTRLGTINPQELSEIADIAMVMSNSSAVHFQKVLEETNVIKRASLALGWIKHESEVLQRMASIRTTHQHSVEQAAAEAEKAAITKEDLFPKKEGAKVPPYQKRWEERLEKCTPPDHVMRLLKEEVERFNQSNPASTEHGLDRTYIDWITQMPWGIYTKDNFDIDKAEEILEKHHFGLKEVKKRIIEFIAVGAVKQNIESAVSQGKILCLIGSPGVGKTSIGKSIAASLDRKFERISVGGMRDVSEIKGHRRTYIGSMPGKFVQALKKAGSINPVIMIDEIEKITQTGEGDPSAALLEVLDPEQNKAFMDHYLDIPIDLSKVLFICTGNSLNGIPEPLMDRMEIIEVPGYSTYEKLQIAENYLFPKVAKETAVPQDAVKVSPSMLTRIIDEYCREPGVRVLQQKIEALYRQVAVKMVTEQEKELEVTEKNMREYLGKPGFSISEAFLDAPAGVVVGLGYTAYGGNILILESVSYAINKERGQQPVKVTGNLGEVLIESTSVAQSYARKLLREYHPDNKFFDENNVSIHLPNGAVKKEGPSAGIALVTALVSLATGQKVDPRLAMTGEVTLTGRVIGVGGIKEKLLGAQRSGIKRICLPHDNKFDFDELDEELRKEFDEVTFYKRYEDLYQYLFTSPTKSEETTTSATSPPPS